MLESTIFDFSFIVLKRFLTALSSYTVVTVLDFIKSSEKDAIILRHDVDRLPQNALMFSGLLRETGIYGTFYFRIVPGSFDNKTIEKISSLGHEIGYHYEEISLTARSMMKKINTRLITKIDQNELIDRSIERFAANLATLRKHATIRTICMHGSPLCKIDNRLLWSKYDYKKFGIIGEPYFDIDYSRVAYYTDTGRRWDGDSVSVRDKVNHGEQNFPKFRSTFDIIRAAESGTLPSRVMFTFHPQRWHDRPLPWLAEWASQNAKNAVKRWFFVPGQKDFFETSRSHAKQNIK